jgi:GT2 family glycosyltransferase
MKIFVLIVTYNAEKWLDFCIGNLRASTIDVIPLVVDNNSSDATVALIKKNYPETILIENNQNLGFGKANNVGIKYAIREGFDYIFLLNQDASVFPDTIENLVNVSVRHPNYLILTPVHLDGSKKLLDHNFSNYLLKGDKLFSADSHTILSDLLLDSNSIKEVYSVRFVNAALWLLTSKCVEVVGGFDPIFPHYGEDDDFVNRVLYHGHEIGICFKSFGIHDRPQKTAINNAAYKTTKRKYIAFLIGMKNINIPFYLCILLFLKDYPIAVLRIIKSGNIKELLADTKARILLLANLLKIYKHRKISKNSSYNFLKNNFDESITLN